MHVDSVKQRTADAGNVALDLEGIALTWPASIAQIPARTWIHGRHEDETGREGARSQGPGDSHPPFFQRLAEDFQTTAMKLRQLVEKKHAVMGQADLAGRGNSAAADHAGVADSVMWRAKGPSSHERLV